MTANSRPRRVTLWPLALLLLVAAGVGAGWAWEQYHAFADRPLRVDGTRVLQVAPGDSLGRVVGRIREAGIDDGHDLMWQLLGRQLGVSTRLQVGEYALTDGVSPRQLLQRIARGDVLQYRFTIVEGWNFRELRAALGRSDTLTQTLPDLTDDEVMQALGRPGLHPEGRFLPETYQYTRGTTDLEVLRRALQAMDRALDAVWAARTDGLPLETAEQALVLASIIEKETGQVAERREIAGVFVRRLKSGMKLQTDPTVIYGLGEGFNGNLTRAHLRADTPWNTYARHGLPPTPIAMPGLAALKAAVDPAPGDTLYFVSRGDGSHQFSRTLDEHNRAVRRYQLGQQ